MDKNYLVTKSNYFIMNSSYDLSLEEQKIILTLASMVQPSDEEFKPYKFKIADFIELLGVENQAKYTEVPKITKELMKKVFEIEEGKTLIQTAWLSGVKYEKGTGYVELTFSPYLKPYMLQLKEKFTQYQLANVLSMKSKYSSRIYEILKCNEFKKQSYTEISIETLRKLMKAEKTYPLYADFKRFIIKQAQKELRKLTDLDFEFEEIKTGRKVTTLRFYIRRNAKKVDIDSTIAEQIGMEEILNPENAATVDEEPAIMITERELAELKAIFTEHELSSQAICAIYEDSKKNIELVRECYSQCLENKSTIGNVVGYMRKLVKDYEPSMQHKPTKQVKKNKFLNFPQTKYDFAEIEKMEMERTLESMKEIGILKDEVKNDDLQNQ